MRKLTIIVALFSIVVVTSAHANTIASSTMWFEGSLESSSGGYVGTLTMIDDASISGTLSGFDVYAENGAWATYRDGGTGGPDGHYNEGVVTNHDAYTTAGGWGSWYNPDCADYYHYQLTVNGTDWALEYVSSGTAYAAPMSGTVDWSAGTDGYAVETGTGAYYSSVTATPLHEGYAAEFAATKGQSTVGAWDMDWSWGSDYVPLQYPGFDIEVSQIDNGLYRVSLTPVPVPGAVLLGLLGLGVAGRKLRKRA